MLRFVKKHWLNISIIWCLYGLFVIASADVSWRPEFKKDGWYKIYEVQEGDYDTPTYSIVKSTEGPYTKNEIDNFFSYELKRNEIFIERYGTIYNLPYWLYYKNSIFYNLFGLVIHFIFFIGIPILLYSIANKTSKS
jgi:hypothetical protein